MRDMGRRHCGEIGHSSGLDVDIALAKGFVEDDSSMPTGIRVATKTVMLHALASAVRTKDIPYLVHRFRATVVLHTSPMSY